MSKIENNSADAISDYVREVEAELGRKLTSNEMQHDIWIIHDDMKLSAAEAAVQIRLLNGD